jgi:beta-galactosidase
VEFLHGTTYYHYANPSEELTDNFKKMRDMGLNCVRTAEIWPGWEQLEPERGKYDFELLDDFIAKANAENMKVILGFGINNPPFWLFEDYPEIRSRDISGKAASRRVQSVDLTNSEYLAAMEKFVRVQAERYADNPAVSAWQFGNEMRFGVRLLDTDSARLKFREYLKEKWSGNIDRLNAEWGTFFRDWNSIYPYKSQDGAPTEGLTPLYLASVDFQNEIIEKFIENGIKIVHEYSDKPVFHNNFSHSAENGSHWRIAASGDWVVQDIYPVTSPNPAVYNTFLLDCALSISRSLDKPLVIGETAVGQYGTYTRNRPDQKQVEALLMEMLGGGVKGLLNFRHKAPKYEQPHKFTGSQSALRRDGSENIYAQTVRQLSSTVNTLNKKNDLSSYQPVKPEIGIYYPEESIRLSRETGFMELQLTAAYGASTLWNRLGTPVHIMPTAELLNERIEQFKVIYLPLSYLLPQAVGERLKEYVKNGGTLISSCRPGYVNELGWLYEEQPGAGLEEVFGASEDLFWNEEEFSVNTENGKSFSAYKACQTLVLNTAEALFTNDAGEIIGCQNNYGKGKAVLLGFAPELNFPFGGGKYDNASSKLSDTKDTNKILLEAIFNICKKDLKPCNFKTNSSDITVRYLQSVDSLITLFCNHGNHDSVSFDKNVCLAASSDGANLNKTGTLEMDKYSWAFLEISV